MTATALAEGSGPHLGSLADIGHEGPAPKRIVVGFGFWVFLLSDIIMFSAFFASYAVLREETAGGPGAAQLFDLGNVAIETGCLLLSSFCCGMASLAVEARRMRCRLGDGAPLACRVAASSSVNVRANDRTPAHANDRGIRVGRNPSTQKPEGSNQPCNSHTTQPHDRTAPNLFPNRRRAILRLFGSSRGIGMQHGCADIHRPAPMRAVP